MLKDALLQMPKLFSQAALLQGQEYYQQSRVIHLNYSEGLVKARVKGTTYPIYDVYLNLKIWPSNAVQCSCAYRRYCKHVAAVLQALEARTYAKIPVIPQVKTTEPIKLFNQATLDNQLIYLLKFQKGYHDKVIIYPALAKRLRKGGLGKKTLLNTFNHAKQEHCQESDLEIMQELLNPYQNWFDGLNVINSQLLEKILLTQRAYFYDNEQLISVCCWLENFLTWKLRADGSQAFSLSAMTIDKFPLQLDKYWYVDKNLQTMGVIYSSLASAQIKQLITTPAVSLLEASDTYSTLAIKPKFYSEAQLLVIQPKTVVTFDAMALGTNWLFFIDWWFDYRSIKVEKKETYAYIFYEDPLNNLIKIKRDLAFEQTIEPLVNQLLNLREPELKEKLTLKNNLKDRKVLADYATKESLHLLYAEVIPKMRFQNWDIQFNHPIYEEIIQSNKLTWYSQSQTLVSGFFSYQLGILIDNKPVNIVPLITTIIKKYSKDQIQKFSDSELFYLPLKNNQTLEIKFGQIKSLLSFILYYRHSINDSTINFDTYQWLLMQEIEQALIKTSKRQQTHQTFNPPLSLQEIISPKTVALPKHLNAQLRSYQHQGVNWLQALRKRKFSGVLADDMGLGKTLQTLVHLQIEQENGRLKKASLVVVPTSLIGNWLEEAKKFTPNLKCLLFYGHSRVQKNFDEYDLIITTYGLVQRDKSTFIDYPFYYLILDEAQFIKNYRTKTNQIIQQIDASHRLCLSGTPLENHLGEL